MKTANGDVASELKEGGKGGDSQRQTAVGLLERSERTHRLGRRTHAGRDSAAQKRLTPLPFPVPRNRLLPKVCRRRSTPVFKPRAPSRVRKKNSAELQRKG